MSAALWLDRGRRLADLVSLIPGTAGMVAGYAAEALGVAADVAGAGFDARRITRVAALDPDLAAARARRLRGGR